MGGKCTFCTVNMTLVYIEINEIYRFYFISLCISFYSIIILIDFIKERKEISNNLELKKTSNSTLLNKTNKLLIKVWFYNTTILSLAVSNPLL